MMKKIKLSKSILSQDEVDALARVLLEDGYLGMGQEVKSFEEELQAFFPAQGEVVCVNSGTAALHLGVMSVIEPGDEVLVQSLTFAASFQAIKAAGGIPVACEVNPHNGTLDLEDAKKKITAKTKVIMPVHYAGGVGEYDAIYAFAKENHLRVVEDAAHAFGTQFKGRRVGSMGDVVCFSFDGIKNITAGEGGAVVSEDDVVLQFVKDARLLGIQKDTEKRFGGERSWEFDIVHSGYRYHMSNLNAAIGRVQLTKFQSFARRRVALMFHYLESLKDISAIEAFELDYANIIPHIFPIKVLENRDGLRECLQHNHIETGIHYYPNHLLTYFGAQKGLLPVTEKLYEQILTLPLHPDVSDEDQRHILQTIKRFYS
ncbi:MAG: DegT/DnrJ/EryC1/StrS family aminotransferase [Candidatus Omnitrophica bacterium]|nr:DegT/DnrJ/EryC1/StrS family aminotransferase [Candidatus Omnitrophota bacterium]